MKISYIEPIMKNGKRVERIFGCSYVNYEFPNIYVLQILAQLETNHEVEYNQDFLYFKSNESSQLYFRNNKSDVYLIFSVNLSMDGDIGFAKRLIDCKPEVSIIFLGPAPTLFPEKYLVHQNIYVVRGEPDIAVPQIVKLLSKRGALDNVNGLSYIENGRVRHNGEQEIINDLDGLPFPARHLVNKHKYYNPKLNAKPFTAVITSRGCSYKCIYCVPCALSFARELEYKKNHNCKPPVRMRSAGNVIEEFIHLKKTGYKAVSIIDDQFVWDKKRALEICEGIKDLKLLWGCLCRADRIDEEIIKSMKDAGCRYIDVGVESFNDEILKYSKKGVSSENLIKSINLIRKSGIWVKANILFGASPYETRNTIAYTLNKIKELDIDQVMFDICSPFPGTEFYNIALREGWLVGGKYKPSDVASTASVSYPHLSYKELEKIVRCVNIKTYFSPKFIIRNMIRLKNPFFIIKGLKALFKKIMR